MFDFSRFSDPVEIEVGFVRVGDYVEHEIVLAPHGQYEGRRVRRGLVTARSKPAGLDGKLRLDLVDALGDRAEVRLAPDARVMVRRPDRA